MQFTTICQKLIDAWIGTGAGSAAEDVYGSVIGGLGLKMRLSLIEIIGDDPRDWYLRKVKSSRISTRLINLDALFQDGRLGDFQDQAYLEHAVFPKYAAAIERRQPMIDAVETRLAGMRVVYDRIIIPEKAASPTWLLICTNGRFMARLPAANVAVDAIDEAILESLLNGSSAKEIAAELKLSPRTIEHRLERLKGKFGARSLPHLAAMLVATGFNKAIDYAGEGGSKF